MTRLEGVQHIDLRRALLACACAGVVGAGWLVPTEVFGIGTGMQQWLIGIAITLLASALWITPDLLQRRRLSSPEWTLAAFIAFGTLITLVLHPVALGRLAQTVWWIQALLLVVILARLADRRLLVLSLHAYGVIAVTASTAFLLQRALELDGRVPFVIHRNHFAFLLILPTLFYLHRLFAPAREERSLWAAVPLAVLLPALLVTQSRAAWAGVALAALALLTCLLWKNLSRRTLRHSLLVAAAAAAIGVGVLAFDRAWTHLGHTSLFAVLDTFSQPDEGSIGGRLRRWANAWLLIRDHWGVGTGLGSWGSVYENYRHRVIADSAGDPSALNTYLLVMAETGVIGLILLLVTVAGAVRNAFRSGLPAGLLAAVLAWLVAIGFHSLYDFKLVLFGFAFLLGALLWREPEPVVPAARRDHLPMRLAGLTALCLLFVMDMRYGLAWIERDAVYQTIWARSDDGANRLLWRVLAPVSDVITVPMTRDTINGNHEGLAAANRYQVPDQQDFQLLRGNLYGSNGRTEDALRAYEHALARNPHNLSALHHACVTASAVGNNTTARNYCERGLRTNPASPGIHSVFAELHQRDGETTEAFERLRVARALLYARLGENDFGLRSRNQVSGHYQQYRDVSDRLLALRQTDNRSPDHVMRDIVEVPMLHKSIAATTCQVYFSANINARYNLWRQDLCAGDARVAVVTNGAHAPFRLRIAGEHLYYLADQRGDNRFALFRLELTSETTSPVNVPQGLLLEYSPSPDGTLLAVVVHHSGAHRLYVGDPTTGVYRQLSQSERPFSEPVWDPNSAQLARRLLVIDTNRRVLDFDVASGSQQTLVEADAGKLEAIALAPDGKSLVYSISVDQQRAQLRIRDRDGADRELVATTDSAIIDPVWLDVDTLAFREVVDDEYLVRRMDLGAASPTPIGFQSGVTYGLHRAPGSSELLFVASTDTIPASLFRLADDSDQAQSVLRLDWIAPETVVPHTRVVIDEALDVVAYRFQPAERGDAAIIWLHGGSSRFSPRWHSYAQYFSTAGYEFVALNYRPITAVGPDRHEEQAEDLRNLVRTLRAEGFRRVYLIGVSTGTQVVQTYLGREFDSVDGIVEYSPVDNPRWNEPRRLPPLIAFTGANDPLINHRRREAQNAAHRALGSEISWVVYDDEGHDLRGRRAIQEHMVRSLQFLGALDGDLRPGAKAAMTEVPWLDENAGLFGSGDSTGLGAERLSPPPLVRMLLEPAILR